MRSVPEWIGKTADTRIPDRVQLRVFERADCCCAWCGVRIFVLDLVLDHKIAIINGGENRESNLQPLHTWCHKRKTVLDVLEKKKAYRKRKKHVLGGKYRSITGWRRFDGSPVHKPRERR
jgi:5-methylcytosine-specific restriction endonuclease McrA